MAYAPLTKIPQQFFDNLGNPLVSGTLYAYLAGTSTPTNMFSDNAGTVAGTSVVLDSRGEPTTFKLIWLNTAVIYKFVLKDSTGTTIWTIDNISGDDGTGNTASSVFDQQTLTATAGQTLFTLGYEYVTGTNAMAVYKNGSRLITGTDFTETSSTSVTLTMAAIAGDEYTFIGGQDVSSSFSGTNVSFIQSGTGAVTRSVQTKLRETVSVKDFGAVGDGTTDDTAAMNAAAAAAGAAKKALFVPAGVYKMTAPWVIPVKVYVLGESPSIQSSYDPGATWNYGAIIFKAHTGNAITKTGTVAYEEGAPIENITISSHRTLYPGGNGIVLDKVSNCHIIRCNAFGVGGDCFVLGVTAGDVTGHNYAFNCYSNNPSGVHYRVRQKWGRFHYPVTDGGTYGMYLDNAPETHVDGFHFEGFTTAAVRLANANTSSRFVGKGFVGNTSTALSGFVIDSVAGNSNIVVENTKFNGNGLASSVAVSIGASAINCRVQGCEINSWATGIDNNANFGTANTWVLNSTFYNNALCIRSNGENTIYQNNSFDTTTGLYDISHVFGTKGLWTGNTFNKTINPIASGVQGNFSGICVKNNTGYVSRNSGTTGAIPAYTTWAHGLAGTPAADIVLTTNSSGVTSVPQIATRDATNLALYWTGTVNVQWNWQARLPCDF